MYALITGSSKGIGLALTNLLLKNNFIVHGYSRSNNLIHSNFKFHKTDLSKITRLSKISFPKIRSSKRIFLINNAGEIGSINKIGNKKTTDIINEININITAPTILCNQFIKAYRDSESKLVIINISSGAAIRPIHSWGTYCQSKAGLDMLTKILNEEHLKIKTISIYPGVVNTDMQKKIRNTKEEKFPLKDQFMNYYNSNVLSDPINVAKKIFYIMSNFSEFDNNMISLRDF